MSYLERGIYDYIFKILTDGVKVLFNKRFIIFTLLLLLSGLISIFVLINKSNLEQELIQNFLLLQSAIAISFIVAGLFAKRMLSTIRRFVLVIVIIILIIVLGLGSSQESLNIPIINQILLEYFPVICLLLWTLFMPIAGFGFARGMFYNRITGSLLFLGKPEEDKKAIFYVFIIIITFIGGIIGILIFMTHENPLIKSAGLFAGGISFLMIFIAYGVIIRNDALNSAISVFFIASAIPTMIMLLVSSDNGIIGTFNYILLGFSLIFTAQGQARRASKFSGKSEQDIRLEMAKEKHKSPNSTDTDPFGVSKLFNFLGAEGIVLIFLGTFFGYNLLQIEFFHDKTNTTKINPLMSSVFDTMTVGQLYQSISMIIIGLFIIFIIITNFTFPPARKYYRADLIRLAFLPNYDEVKNYITAVQSGDINKKDMTADAVKLVGGQLAKASLSAGRGFFGKIFKKKENSDD